MPGCENTSAFHWQLLTNSFKRVHQSALELFQSVNYISTAVTTTQQKFQDSTTLYRSSMLLDLRNIQRRVLNKIGSAHSVETRISYSDGLNKCTSSTFTLEHSVYMVMLNLVLKQHIALTHSSRVSRVDQSSVRSMGCLRIFVSTLTHYMAKNHNPLVIRFQLLYTVGLPNQVLDKRNIHKSAYN